MLDPSHSEWKLTVRTYGMQQRPSGTFSKNFDSYIATA